jgi:hypothetical protein
MNNFGPTIRSISSRISDTRIHRPVPQTIACFIRGRTKNRYSEARITCSRKTRILNGLDTSRVARDKGVRARNIGESGTKLKKAQTAVAEIYYLENGPADGSPVLLLHGFPDDPGGFNSVVMHIRGRGLRVIHPYLLPQPQRNCHAAPVLAFAG